MEGIYCKIIVAYLIIMNIAGVFVMFIDKRKAIQHRYRIPKKTLFLVSLLGGSIGTLAGMYLFRHKTKHWYFVVGMPLICILHIILAIYIWR